MKQLVAVNNQMRITQRYIDGTKFLKVTPENFHHLILDGLKKQFKDKPVEIEVSESRWIRIKKTAQMEEFEEVGRKLVGDEITSEDYILNKEAEILKSQGFKVTIEDI